MRKKLNPPETVWNAPRPSAPTPSTGFSESLYEPSTRTNTVTDAVVDPVEVLYSNQTGLPAVEGDPVVVYDEDGMEVDQRNLVDLTRTFKTPPRRALKRLRRRAGSSENVKQYQRRVTRRIGV